MPGRLTAVPSASRVRFLPALRQLGVVLAVFAVGGAVAGVLWEWIWTPPSGVVVEQEWRLDASGLRGEVSGTVLYVLVAAVAGLLLGVLVAVVLDRGELITLVGAVAGSVLAGWVMLQVGLALDPPDPQALAATAEQGTRLPGELDVAGRSPFVAFPSGALVGLLVVFIGLTRHPENDT